MMYRITSRSEKTSKSILAPVGKQSKLSELTRTWSLCAAEVSHGRTNMLKEILQIKTKVPGKITDI
jgi:hypothetical protein